jgi:hypothetical protein
VVLIWLQAFAFTESSSVTRAIVFSTVAVPSYVLFALLMMFVSAVTVRTLRWETPANVDMRIADLDWPLLRWARSMVATHIVRVFAGALFRGSPAAPLRLGSNVTIGLGSVLEIGVLSLVPKHTRLDGGAVYAGIPAHRLA